MYNNPKLLSGFNAWARMDKFFSENKEIQPILQEVEEELLRDHCYSKATMYIATIERLLERIE